MRNAWQSQAINSFNCQRAQRKPPEAEDLQAARPLIDHPYDTRTSREFQENNRPGEEITAETQRTQKAGSAELWNPGSLLTAHAHSEDRTRAMLAGFTSHIARPAETAELVATVATLTRRQWASAG